MSDQAAHNLLVIAGPTAVGKSEVALRVAEHFQTAIVSADSRQIFKEIPIGTAQPTTDELKRVPHHFIAERSVTEPYNAGMFEREALKRLETLFCDYQTIVCCGGTGLYIKALCEGLDELPKADPAVRRDLNFRLRNEGLSSLQQQMQQLDPLHYERMDAQNPQRLIRALEVCITTGRPFSSFHGQKSEKRPFAIRKIGLERPREELYQRIEQRVDAMLENGWLEEAREVYPLRSLNSLNTVGYKELFAHFDGEMPLAEAVVRIKTSTRRFAKRQLTWFRRDTEMEWMHPDKAVANLIAPNR